MCHDLDDTLSNLPSNPAAPPQLRAGAVMFLPPDRTFASEILGQPAINLFLHRIRENRELADNVPSSEPGDHRGRTVHAFQVRTTPTDLLAAAGGKGNV